MSILDKLSIKTEKKICTRLDTGPFYFRFTLSSYPRVQTILQTSKIIRSGDFTNALEKDFKDHTVQILSNFRLFILGAFFDWLIVCLDRRAVMPHM